MGERRGPAAAAFTSFSERLEPDVRVLVADVLGVDGKQLQAGMSLVDDLAADSLDVLDLVVRVEEQFDVAVPEREIGVVLTYGDLVVTTAALVACRTLATDREHAAGRVELCVGNRDGGVPRFLRVFGPTPYDGQLLAADLRAARPGEPLEVRAAAAAPVGLERALVRSSLAGVDVHTDRSGTAAGTPVGADDGRAWAAGRLIARPLAVVSDLDGEREASARDDAGELARRRAAVDEAIGAFRAVVDAYLDVVEDTRTALDVAARELGKLRAVRAAVDAGTLSAGEVQGAYGAIADAVLRYAHELEAGASRPRTRLPPRPLRAREGASAPERESLRA